MFEEITTLAIFHFFVIFCRIGSAMMIFPGFGEVYVTPKSRLAAAIVVSLVIHPVLSPTLPALPVGILNMFMVIMPEILIGIFIGMMVRMVQSVLHIGGMIIAFQSSLASALLFDANQGSQGSVIGNFLTLVGITLVFVTDLHHLMLMGVVDSYNLFEAGNFPQMSELAEMAIRNMSGCFLIAFKIASPLVVIGLCFYLGSGILGRLMPQMQVFMVMIPAQLYVAFTIIMVSFSAGMMLYLNYFTKVIETFLYAN